ncbi:HIT domain-containing protein [Candidatus Woesearchaeota archaeon]|nr:HIT domain-containing protein [Candidatus Woesearchaeota archaeon]
MGPDQKVTREELANMSPEEIMEYQKKNCVFCHIMEGRVDSKQIYEDDLCKAVLDINPAAPGHTLLMPKEHVSIMPQLSREHIKRMFVTVKDISLRMLRGLEADGTNIFIANGVAAGQKAQHFMTHIIPRKEGDGLTSFQLDVRTDIGDRQAALTRPIRELFLEVHGNNIRMGASTQNPEEPLSPDDNLDANNDSDNTIDGIDENSINTDNADNNIDPGADDEFHDRSLTETTSIDSPQDYTDEEVSEDRASRHDTSKDSEEKSETNIDTVREDKEESNDDGKTKDEEDDESDSNHKPHKGYDDDDVDLDEISRMF